MNSRPPFARRLAVGGASGVAAVAVGFLVTNGSPRWIVFAVAKTIFFLLPDAVIQLGIEQMGGLSQPVLVAGSAAVAVGLLGGITLGGLRLGDAAGRGRAEAVFLVGVGQAFVTFLLTVAPAASLAGGVAGGGVLAVSGAGDTRVDLRRRNLLKAGGAAAATVAAGGALAASRLGGSDRPDDEEVTDPLVRELLAVADERSLDVPGVEGLVSDGFYEVDINPGNPRITRAEWSLRLTGALEEPIELSFEELRALPTVHRFASLRCVGDELNGQKLDTALWTGVPVSAVLDEAELDEAACCVLARAADDYFVEFPIEPLREATLAFRMNGHPLPTAHGAPVRLLVPGRWGEVNTKWIEELELVTEPDDGYWERRGWEGTGPVTAVAKLHELTVEEDRVTVAGHAYAGTRGVSAVEVSTDGGESWTTAELSDPLPSVVPADAEPTDETVREGVARDAWRMWRHEYTASESHEVIVRAREADGTLQPREQQSPFPRGASGWVSRRVDL